MSSATDTLTVDVPVRTAYNQWTQMESYPKFMSGVESVEQLDPTHLHWKMNVAGVEREFDVEITDQEPDDHIAWSSRGDIKQSGRVEFETVDDGSTEITLTLEWVPDGPTEKAGEAFQVDNALVRRDLQKFKEFIESKGAPEGGWRGEVHGGQVQ